MIHFSRKQLDCCWTSKINFQKLKIFRQIEQYDGSRKKQRILLKKCLRRYVSVRAQNVSHMPLVTPSLHFFFLKTHVCVCVYLFVFVAPHSSIPSSSTVHFYILIFFISGYKTKKFTLPLSILPNKW